MMQNFKEVLNIPSSDEILSSLNLSYDGQTEEANPAATFGFSVPLVTDECPGQLQYFPLSKNSHIGLNENLDEEAFIEKMSNKKFCVIICNSFDIIGGDDIKTASFSNENGQLSFIAGVWDATEDPLMAATLYSCTFLTIEYDRSSAKRVPYFLKRDQIASWIGTQLTLEQRIELINTMS